MDIWRSNDAYFINESLVLVIVLELWVLSIAITSIFHYLKIVYGCDRFEDKGITFYLENHFFSFIFYTFAK